MTEQTNKATEALLDIRDKLQQAEIGIAEQPPQQFPVQMIQTEATPRFQVTCGEITLVSSTESAKELADLLKNMLDDKTISPYTKFYRDKKVMTGVG